MQSNLCDELFVYWGTFAADVFPQGHQKAWSAKPPGLKFLSQPVTEAEEEPSLKAVTVAHAPFCPPWLAPLMDVRPIVFAKK